MPRCGLRSAQRADPTSISRGAKSRCRSGLHPAPAGSRWGCKHCNDAAVSCIGFSRGPAVFLFSCEGSQPSAPQLRLACHFESL